MHCVTSPCGSFWLRWLLAASPDLIEQLTERELEVLQVLAEGLTYAQIARQLVLSVNTVRYHIKSVYGMLGVEKRMHTVKRGRALGLISP